MTSIATTTRTRSDSRTGDRASRVRDLARAGAGGRALAPVEVKEVCEAALRSPTIARTNFHGFSG